MSVQSARSMALAFVHLDWALMPKCVFESAGILVSDCRRQVVFVRRLRRSLAPGDRDARIPLEELHHGMCPVRCTWYFRFNFEYRAGIHSGRSDEILYGDSVAGEGDLIKAGAKLRLQSGDG